MQDEITVEAIAVRVADAVKLSGLSKSEIYRRAGSGELLLRKCGTSTVVDFESLKALVRSLPAATITTRS